jgi:hypothetical protein
MRLSERLDTVARTRRKDRLVSMAAQDSLDRRADARIIIDDEDASWRLGKPSNSIRDLLRREFHESLVRSPSQPSRYDPDTIRVGLNLSAMGYPCVN